LCYPKSIRLYIGGLVFSTVFFYDHLQTR